MIDIIATKTQQKHAKEDYEAETEVTLEHIKSFERSPVNRKAIELLGRANDDVTECFFSTELRCH